MFGDNMTKNARFTPMSGLRAATYNLGHTSLIWPRGRIALISSLAIVSCAVLLCSSCRRSTHDNESARSTFPETDWVDPFLRMEFVWLPKLRIWAGKYEVTNGQFRRFRPEHKTLSPLDADCNGENQPVGNVNHEDVMHFLAWYNEHLETSLPQGYHIRLPTESEWITFARAGRRWKYPWGNNWPPVSGRAGNYDDETDYSPDVVGGILEIESLYKDGYKGSCDVQDSFGNPWSLYGVGGNVWEMTVLDHDKRIFGSWRGGAYITSIKRYMRCDSRLEKGYGTNEYALHRFQDRACGFRVVLSRVDN